MRRLEAARSTSASYDLPAASALFSKNSFSGITQHKSGDYHSCNPSPCTADYKAPGYRTEMTSEGYSGPPVWVTVLEDKINKQSRTVDSLTETVISLQNEKERQNSTIEQLKDTVASLQQRVEEKGVDLDTENKMSLWRQETRHEINNLKLQVEHQQESRLSRTTPKYSVDELLSQVSDAKNVCREEAESARKDIDYYKNRMTRLEKSINVLSEEFDRLNRGHNELRTDMMGVDSRAKQHYRELASSLSQKLVDINLTRTEMSALKADLAENTNRTKQQQQQRPSNAPAVPMAVNTRSALHQSTEWRELLSHSLSSISVASSSSTLSSGYLARKRSKDSNEQESGRLLAGGLADSSSSDEIFSHSAQSTISTPSSSPTSLSINDL